MEKPKIAVFLTNNYEHDPRAIKEAESLSKNFEVEVICPKGRKGDAEEVKGRGVVARRVFPAMEFSKKFGAGKLAKFLLFAPVGAVEGARSGAKIFHANDLTTLPMAFFAAKADGARVAYDSHEIFCEMKYVKKAKEALERIEQWLAPKCGARMTVSEEIAEHLEEKTGAKFEVIPNYPRKCKLGYEKTRKEERKRRGIGEREVLFIYYGLILPERGVKEAIEAFKKVKKREIKFFIAGSSERWPKIAETGDERIRFLGKISAEEVEKLEIAADVSFINYQNTELNNYYSAPNKLYSGMMNGCALIASNFPTLKRIIEKEKTGILVNPESVGETAKAIEYIASHPKELKEMQERGRKAGMERYNWEAIEPKFLKIYGDLVKSK